MAATTSDNQAGRETAELAWLSDVLGGPTQGTDTAYLCRPNSTSPTVFLPISPRPASVAAVRRGSSDSTTKERLLGLGARVAARTGRLGQAPGERIVLPKFVAITELEKRLGEPRLIASIGLGPRRRNRKPILQLIRPDGVVVGFAKVGWSDLTRELVANEARWLKTVEGRLPTGVTAPSVLLDMEADTWPGESHILVSAALSTSGSTNGAPELSNDIAIQIARITNPRRVRVADLNYLSDWAKGSLNEFVAPLLASHQTESVEIGMWHGDLTPWNTSSSHGRLMIWDWEFADQGRPIGFDILHREFESVRRSEPKAEAKAVSHIARNGPSIVGPYNVAAEAVTDLYLLELLARERRLAGQGWEPTHIGHLETDLLDALNNRLNTA